MVLHPPEKVIGLRAANQNPSLEVKGCPVSVGLLPNIFFKGLVSILQMAPKGMGMEGQGEREMTMSLDLPSYMSELFPFLLSPDSRDGLLTHEIALKSNVALPSSCSLGSLMAGAVFRPFSYQVVDVVLAWERRPTCYSIKKLT